MRTLNGEKHADTPTKADPNDTIAFTDGLTHLCSHNEWDATTHFYCGEWTRSSLFSYGDINKGHITCLVCASRVTDKRGS